MERANISSEAQDLMVACFVSGMSDQAISDKIAAELGETVAVRTIGRRKSDWRATQSRIQRGREQMTALLRAARDEKDTTASEMINALAREQLMRDPDGTLALNPIELQRVSVAAERVRIQRERLEITRRQIELEEKKFQALQEREQRAIAAVSGDGEKKLTAEERVRKVREIYGLKNEAA